MATDAQIIVAKRKKGVILLSEKEKKAAESMAAAIRDMDDTQCAVALAYVEGMRAQKMIAEGKSEEMPDAC